MLGRHHLFKQLLIKQIYIIYVLSMPLCYFFRFLFIIQCFLDNNLKRFLKMFFVQRICNKKLPRKTTKTKCIFYFVFWITYQQLNDIQNNYFISVQLTWNDSCINICSILSFFIRISKSDYNKILDIYLSNCMFVLN